MIVTNFILFMCLTSLTFAEVCRCPVGYELICDKSVAITMNNACAKLCVDFILPENDSFEEHPCTIREEVLSQSRPAYILDILHHQCFCISKLSYNPVCNTHFVTFINECAMQCIKPQSLIAKSEACVAKNQALSCASCFRNSHPVCATNGETYPNKCIFECFKRENNVQDVTVLHDGPCTFEDSPFIHFGLSKRSGNKKPKMMSLENVLLPLVKRQHKRNRF